ncbi:MAG: hypothetical protein AAGE01_20130 [Pseudomonadota bacterium]
MSGLQRRIVPLGLLLALLPLLIACGAAPVKLEPPRVSIVELDLQRGVAAIRIDNGVAAPMPANRADFEITVADRSLGRFTPEIALKIPGLSSERFELTLAPETREISTLFEQRGRVAYTVAGTLWLDDGRTLAIASNGRLSPTPGKPGSYR